MRRAIFGVVIASTSCIAFPGQPHPRAGLSMDEARLTMYTATFEVTCDRCHVEYGREDGPQEDTAEGRWRGSAGLGSLRAGDQVRVILRIRPIGDTRVRRARMAVNGNTVATSGEKKPGEPVDLIWMRVGAR